MKTYTISLQKFGIGMLMAAFALTAFASPASANSYYPQYKQPVTYFYQYGQYDYDYQNKLANTQKLMAELQRLQQQLLELQNRYRNLFGQGYTYNTGYNYYGSHGSYDVEVDTLRARDVEDDEATLYGDIDLDDAPYADVWFEYGEDSDLDDKSSSIRVDDDGDFDIDVDDLDEDERYYFRAVAKAPNGEYSYGRVLSFDADNNYDDDDDDYNDDDDDYNDDEPSVETEDAEDVSDDSADLEGSVDMNDFEDGLVFFVWGEDEDMVEDVDGEDSYSDIDEDGADLQKYSVSNGLDGSRDFTLTVYGLDDETDYYFRICVEYEDEDDDETLECGSVEHFETD